MNVLSLETIVILVNLGLLVFAELFILYTIDYKKNVLLILSAAAGITIYCGYLSMNQPEGSIMELLLIVLSGVFWLVAFIQMTPYAFSVTEKMRTRLPPEMVLKVSRDMMKDRNFTHLKSEYYAESFKAKKTKVDIETYSFFKVKYVEVSVSPLGGIGYRLFFILGILAFIPIGLSLYNKSTLLFQIPINDLIVDVYASYFVFVFLLIMWQLAKRIRSSLTKQLGIIWSDLLTRLEKLKEALRIMEGIQRAKRVLEEKKQRIIKKGLEIARSIALAESIVEQKRRLASMAVTKTETEETKKEKKQEEKTEKDKTAKKTTNKTQSKKRRKQEKSTNKKQKTENG